MPITETAVAGADDLARLPRGTARHELVYGEIRSRSLAGAMSGAVAARVVVTLGGYIRSGGRGVVVIAEGGFRLTSNPDTVRAPDAAFVRSARVPQGVPKSFFPGAPDLAVEVLSPTDSLAAMLEKADFWLFHGAIEVWVVDPRSATVRVRTSGAPERVLGLDDTLESRGLLPGLSVRVRELFQD